VPHLFFGAAIHSPHILFVSPGYNSTGLIFRFFIEIRIVRLFILAPFAPGTFAFFSEQVILRMHWNS
jgi:hypothetical protein